MATTYWLKQTKDKSLFESLLWSRPENKRLAGRLLIVGGNLHGFAAPGMAYSAAAKAGVGSTRIIMPDKLQRTVGKLLPEAEFASSTLSGSFSKMALAQLIEAAEWAEAVLLAGDFGGNSETVVLLENFLSKYGGPVILSGDSLDDFLKSGSPLVTRNNTLSVVELTKLQRLAKNNRPSSAITSNMMITELVDILHDWTAGNAGQLITYHAGNYIVASGGQVSTTLAPEQSNWRVELAAYASVWWLQQPQKLFEALTCATYYYVS